MIRIYEQICVRQRQTMEKNLAKIKIYTILNTKSTIFHACYIFKYFPSSKRLGFLFSILYSWFLWLLIFSRNVIFKRERERQC